MMNGYIDGQPTMEPTMEPTMSPTVEATVEDTKDWIGKAKEKDTLAPVEGEVPQLDLDKVDKNAAAETDSPTELTDILVSPPTIAPILITESPTESPIMVMSTDPPILTTESPTESPLMILMTDPPAKNDKVAATTTTAPTVEEGVAAAEEVTEPPTMAPSVSSPQPDTTSTTTTTDTPAPQPTTTSTTNTTTTTSPPSPYPIRLDPLYMTVTLQGNVNEEGYMELLVDYMESNMAKDFDGFESITYGASLYSQMTNMPSPDTVNPMTNVTVHIHLLTSNFVQQSATVGRDDDSFHFLGI